MKTPRTEVTSFRVGRRAYTVTFQRDRMQHPRLGRMRNTMHAYIDTPERTVGVGVTYRNPKDKNNPNYAKSTAFRRAVEKAYQLRFIAPNTRIALYKAFFAGEKAAA